MSGRDRCDEILRLIDETLEDYDRIDESDAEADVTLVVRAIR